MKHVSRKSLYAASLLLITAVSIECVAGHQYRWQDSQGNTIYSDRPPPGAENYEMIDTGPTLYSPAAEVAPEEGANDLAADEKDAELCEQAKMNLISLQAQNKLSIRNEKGETKELSAKEREVALQVAAARKDVYCD